MEEFKLTGIVTGAMDYKEKDKLVTLYTLQLGKMTAVLKGVKNKNAKLKFASQPFCFGQFIVVKNGEFYTVTSAEQMESFYNLTQNYARFLVGQLALEVTNTIMQPNMIYESYFVLLLKLLRSLCYDEGVHEKVLLTKFLLSVYAIMGYELNFKTCNECETPLNQEVFFNFDLGALTCKGCAAAQSFELTKKQFTLLKIIHQTEMEQLKTIGVKAQDLTEILLVLGKNFEYRFGRKIKILTQYLLEQ